MSSSPSFQQGAYLVYVNGLEIPCPSVSINYGVWQIPEATLAFPPHRLLQRLGAEDRVDVAIFFLDKLTDPERPEFRLCFEGEIMGWSYRSTPSGRMMQFNCIAHMSILQILHFFFMNNVDTALEHATNLPGQSTTLDRPGVFYPFSLFKQGLLTTDASAVPDIERTYDLMYNVVKGMISKKIPHDRRAIPGVNFFNRWSRKTNFHNRFAALPLFEDEGNKDAGVFPILKAVQAAEALNTLQQNVATSIGAQGSLWQNIQTLMNVVYCEVAMLPTAPCVRVRLSDGRILGPPSTALSSPDAEGLEPLRLLNYFVKPQMLFGAAPTCNVFFPSMVRGESYQESYVGQPTRVYMNDTFVPVVGQHPAGAAALTAAYPPEVKGVLDVKTGKDGARDPLVTGKNVLVYPEELFKGPVTSRGEVPSWFTYLQNKKAETKGEASLASSTIDALFDMYVKYEYYRLRYEKRGGSVDLLFNPFVVPGFPCVTFDRREGAYDTTGYVTSVTQSLSRGSMATSVSYGYGRTLLEMLETIRDDSQRLGLTLTSAPADALDEVRDITQVADKAESFYNALFHQRQTGAKTAAFDYREVVGFVKEDVNRYPDELEVEAVDLTALPEDGELQPLAAFADHFNDYETAMRYVARPICTLREYISFVHGGKTLEELSAEGQVSGPVDTFTYTQEGDDAPGRYWTRIRRFRQGPGTRPEPDQLGAHEDGSAYTGATRGLPSDYPQTRRDWDSKLEEYRAQVTRDAPLR